VTSKTLRFHNPTKQDKGPGRSVWNLKTNCKWIKSNKIWFGKIKSEGQRKETIKAERKTKRMMLWKDTENFPLMM